MVHRKIPGRNYGDETEAAPGNVRGRSQICDGIFTL
jgi:hypothetical protein